jgi:hypothetical protein
VITPNLREGNVVGSMSNSGFHEKLFDALKSGRAIVRVKDSGEEE